MNVSNTDRNLWTAFIEEAVAERKYHAFAMRALDEGYPRVAEIFLEIGGSEALHALSHLRTAGESRSTWTSSSPLSTSCSPPARKCHGSLHRRGSPLTGGRQQPSRHQPRRFCWSHSRSKNGLRASLASARGSSARRTPSSPPW